MTKTKIMGILNVTPDLFSDGEQCHSVDQVVKRTREMIDGGIDIIDTESVPTRPGHKEVSYKEVSLKEETSHVLFVAESTAKYDAQISANTFRSEVTEACLKPGVSMINDQQAGLFDPNMSNVILQYGVEVVLMYGGGGHRDRPVVKEMFVSLLVQTNKAELTGIPHSKIWSDPGIGFVKIQGEENGVMARLDELVAIEYPVLLGTGRKRYTKEMMNQDSSPLDRDEAAAATTIHGIMKGVHEVRVHNVLLNMRLARNMDLLEKSEYG